MIPLDEELFPVDNLPGFAGGPNFPVIVLRRRDGKENRIVNRITAMRSYDVSPLIRSEEVLQTVQGFFMARNGSSRAFRFKDWTDYTTSNVDDVTVPSSMSTSCGWLAETEVDDTYQLWKIYSDGNGYTYYRRIVKPRSSNFRIFSGSTDKSSFYNKRTDFSLSVSGTFSGFSSAALTDNVVTNTPTTAQMWASSTNTGNRWVTVDFTTARTIRKLRWYPRATTTSNDKEQSFNWTFLGSNSSDFSTSETLATVPSGYHAGWNEVLVTPSSAYRYYRITKTSSGAGTSNYLTFVEIEFYELLTSYTLNTETGILTVDPLAGSVDGWIGEFDVPVRFSPNLDSLTGVSIDDFRNGSVTLTLEEVPILEPGDFPVWETDTPLIPIKPGPGRVPTGTSGGPPISGGPGPGDGGDGDGGGGDDPFYPVTPNCTNAGEAYGIPDGTVQFVDGEDNEEDWTWSGNGATKTGFSYGDFICGMEDGQVKWTWTKYFYNGSNTVGFIGWCFGNPVGQDFMTYWFYEGGTKPEPWAESGTQRLQL